MKYLLTPILLLPSTPIMAHPGHAAGQPGYVYVAALIALSCVIAGLLGYLVLLARRDPPAKPPQPHR